MLSSIYVTRRSYHQDLIFRLLFVKKNGIALLSGYQQRIFADAPISDLIRVYPDSSQDLLLQWEKRCQKHIHKLHEQRYPLKILHIDSDPKYLSLCLSCYRLMHLTAIGIVIPESRQPLAITALLQRHHPNILILTGHDALPKGQDPKILSNYKSSCYFAEAVKMARHYDPDPDRLCIYAGACQSYYEELLDAGANYAASPGRVLIHALDPLIVCETLAFTPFDTVIRATDITQNTYSGPQGIGGFPTYGKLRITTTF